MRFLRPRFQKLVPYYSKHITEGVILNANESAYAAPAALAAHMKEWVGEALMSRYPDTDSTKLASAIAEAFKVAPENVVCGVGSDEIIDCILSATIDENDKVLAPQPSFSMYAEFTVLNSGQFLAVPLKEDFSYDVSAICEMIKKEQPKVTFLCNPNNPTGCILTVDEIKQIISVAEGLVIVDEAYAEFDYCKESMIPYINEFDNMIVLKTFSKAYALAGARVGYGIACKALIDLINTVIVPYNLSIFSQEVATWAITHREAYKPQIDQIVADREKLAKALQALDVKTYPSAANFIWTELPEGVFEELEQKQIYIRRMLVAGKAYFRITVGTSEENEKLIEALQVALHK